MIPTEFHNDLNAAPDDMVLRRAIADWLEEEGDPLAAEAIRWSVAKGRTPARSFGKYEWWSSGRYAHDAGIPKDLQLKMPMMENYETTMVDALVRLIKRWKNSTPQERASYWQWEPEGRVEA